MPLCPDCDRHVPREHEGAHQMEHRLRAASPPALPIDEDVDAAVEALARRHDGLRQRWAKRPLVSRDGTTEEE